MRIGVVGSGIAGAASAWLLSRRHEVTVFERSPHPGGHTRTIEVPFGRLTRPVDTGFIVYNTTTYPLFVRLLDELGVATQASEMSWSLTCATCELAYAGSARGALAQPRRLLDRAHLRMLADIGRFNRVARSAIGTAVQAIGSAPDAQSHGTQPLVDGTSGTTALVDFLDEHRLGDGLRRHYLLPMVAAIWSSGTEDVERFPVRSLLTFFANHGLLGIRSHLPWRTVSGGARTYLERLLAPLEGRVRTSTPVHAIRRERDGIRIRTANGEEMMDAVVLAGHADESLALLEDPDERERELLGAWRSTINERWVHTDATLLPLERAAWASWNYHVTDCRRPTGAASLSYDMTRLQRLAGDQRVLVSINPPRQPHPDTVVMHDHVTHATYDATAIRTQPELDGLNGVRGTYYAGAWQRWGFHEDGLWSAVRVARHLGVDW